MAFNAFITNDDTNMNDVSYEVKNGVLIMTRPTPNGYGQHKKFYYNVPGIPQPPPAAPERPESDGSDATNQPEDGLPAPPNVLVTPAPPSGPNTPPRRKLQGAAGSPRTPGGGLVRSPAVVFNVPSVDHNISPSLRRKAQSGRVTRMIINEPDAEEKERMAQWQLDEEFRIMNRECRVLELQSKEEFRRAARDAAEEEGYIYEEDMDESMEGNDDDSEDESMTMDDGYASSTEINTEDNVDMDEDSDDERPRAPTPLSSTASVSSIDRFFYDSSSSADPQKANARPLFSHDSFTQSSLSSISTTTGSAFGTAGQQSTAPTPTFNDLSGPGLQRYETPHNFQLGQGSNPSVPAAPNPTRFLNPGLPQQFAMSSGASSVFSPTPSFPAHHTAHNKSVRFREPTPLPSPRDASTTPTAAFPGTLPTFNQRSPELLEKRRQFQAMMMGRKVPELASRRQTLPGRLPAPVEDGAEGGSGVSSTDSLKENVRPRSSLIPGRVPLSNIPMISPNVEASQPPTPSDDDDMLEADPVSPTNFGYSTRTPTKKPVSTNSTPIMTRSRAKAAALQENEDTFTPKANSKGKGKGRA